MVKLNKDKAAPKNAHREIRPVRILYIYADHIWQAFTDVLNRKRTRSLQRIPVREMTALEIDRLMRSMTKL